jgi:uncharacterized repeat protein (TIGR03803 family)
MNILTRVRAATMRVSAGGTLCAAALTAALISAGSAAAGSVTTLYDFCARPNCADGGEPEAALVRDQAGNLYGTTTLGGAHGLGNVFRLIRNKAETPWKEQVLYSFSKSRGEGGPSGGLLMTPAGVLLGTTAAAGGGVHRGGTVYELTFDGSTRKWNATTLYQFCLDRTCYDGRSPNGRLVMSGAGELYGTTLAGGVRDNGTVFKLTYDQAKAAWTERVLHRFCLKEVNQTCPDGTGPGGGLVFDMAGRAYGTTIGGGARQEGVAYELIPLSATSWSEKVIHNFCSQASSQESCTDGGHPVGELVWDADQQRLFGTATLGGAFYIEAGVVFELLRTSAPEWPIKVLYNFCGLGACTDDYSPYSLPHLISDKSGNLFGTTIEGGIGTSSGNGYGTAFELAPGTRPPWQQTVLYSFCQVGGSACSDGEQPLAGLTAAVSAGKFYGATRLGGARGFGTVFELSQ